MTRWDPLLAVLPPLGRGAVRLLARTLTIRQLGLEHIQPLWKEKSPLIYTVWHGRMLMMPYLYGSHRAHVMASRHRDGELVSRFVRGFGLRPVRGSTTRGGAAALCGLARRLRAGDEVAIIPDGPVGPRYVVQPGVIALSKITGAPIFPVGAAASRGWRLKSWDEFMIPAPFARLVVIFGAPITVPRDADRAQQEQWRKSLEERLGNLMWEAERIAGSNQAGLGARGPGPAHEKKI